MNTTNLKFFTGCAAGLALLCSITLCGCSGAENDISALECFAGSCEGEDEENNDDKDHGDNHENNQDFNGNNSNNGRYTNHEDCDDHGLVEDFNCNSSRVGKTLFEENFNMIFVCEETVNGATWEIHPEFSNCSDYKANNSGKESGGSSDSTLLTGTETASEMALVNWGMRAPPPRKHSCSISRSGLLKL